MPHFHFKELAIKNHLTVPIHKILVCKTEHLCPLDGHLAVISSLPQNEVLFQMPRRTLCQRHLQTKKNQQGLVIKLLFIFYLSKNDASFAFHALLFHIV